MRQAKLIGESNEPTDLQEYSDVLLYKWIEEQLQYFPNSRRILAEWIVVAGELFDSVIVRNEIAISDMPPVQLSSLFGNNNDSSKQYCQDIKSTFIDAISLELGEETLQHCNILSKNDL